MSFGALPAEEGYGRMAATLFAQAAWYAPSWIPAGGITAFCVTPVMLKKSKC
jgi:hypothetical protein